MGNLKVLVFLNLLFKIVMVQGFANELIIEDNRNTNLFVNHPGSIVLVRDRNLVHLKMSELKGTISKIDYQKPKIEYKIQILPKNSSNGKDNYFLLLVSASIKVKELTFTPDRFPITPIVQLSVINNHQITEKSKIPYYIEKEILGGVAFFSWGFYTKEKILEEQEINLQEDFDVYDVLDLNRNSEKKMENQFTRTLNAIIKVLDMNRLLDQQLNSIYLEQMPVIPHLNDSFVISENLPKLKTHERHVEEQRKAFVSRLQIFFRQYIREFYMNHLFYYERPVDYHGVKFILQPLKY